MNYDDEEEERVSLVPMGNPDGADRQPSCENFVLKTDSDEDDDPDEELMMIGTVDSVLAKFWRKQINDF